ncbi:MAG TPA: hypothetical protein VGI43_07730 [Mucilaginibacter sp.]|jgi:hypothetical protein
MKTIDNFDPAEIENLRNKFNSTAVKDQFNLTDHLDGHLNVDFNQEIINEIVLWKVNRYVSICKAEWFDRFNELKNIDDLESNKDEIKEILEKMLKTHMIRLPMASTMLRFRNPRVFQIIDARTFRIIFGDNKKMEKKYQSTKEKDVIDFYFDYLIKLRQDCEKKNINFSESDRILYQYDIEENKNFSKPKIK